jgi:hypothetical protein
MQIMYCMTFINAENCSYSTLYWFGVKRLLVPLCCQEEGIGLEGVALTLMLSGAGRTTVPLTKMLFGAEMTVLFLPGCCQGAVRTYL